MKQHTTPEQTAKLIELGFEPMQAPADGAWADDENFTIGELIAMLPKSIKVNDCYFSLTINACYGCWLVEYNDIAFGTEQTGVCKEELIDALFTEIVILKEKGVI